MRTLFRRGLLVPVLLLLAGLVCGAPVLRADPLTVTRVLVSFDQPRAVTITVDLDLTVMMGGPEGYYALATGKGPAQEALLRQATRGVADALPFFVGTQRLEPRFISFVPAAGTKAEFLDAMMTRTSRFVFTASLPEKADTLRLSVPIGAPIDYPLAYTVRVPARHLTRTRWMEAGQHEGDPFDYAGLLPASAPVVTAPPAVFDPDTLSWKQQFPLYLHLGFRHIVPEGTDHILFVLGLFFLGISWRNLLSQTTVFTIAHATTLFLSAWGILRLPPWIVEPMIALSISFIAVENIVSPRLGVTRLVVVFLFGLIHGFGFAGSLSEIPFPRRDFVVALLGFNLGVDLGQLFIIAVAALVFGWWRNRPWFRRWVAVPASGVIAATGLFWAVQRVVFYVG